MNRISFLNYSQLPILATKFWKIPKFDEKLREVFNKTVKFQKKDFYSICYFSHECRRSDELDGNIIIKSNLEIIYKENKIDEICELFDFKRLNNIDINYSLRNYITCPSKSYESLCLSLKDKVDFYINLENGEREITNNFHGVLPNKTVEFLGGIGNILDSDSDKDKFEVF